MVKLHVLFKADLEHLVSFSTTSDIRWYLQIKCTNCGEIPEKPVYVTKQEIFDIPCSSGKAHLVGKCKLCKRDYTIEVEEGKLGTYTMEQTGTGEWESKITLMKKPLATCVNRNKTKAREKAAEMAYEALRESKEYKKAFKIKVPVDNGLNTWSGVKQFFEASAKKADLEDKCLELVPPPHTKFECRLSFDGLVLAVGCDSTKKKAREEAARKVLRLLHQSLDTLSGI